MLSRRKCDNGDSPHCHENPAKRDNGDCPRCHVFSHATLTLHSLYTHVTLRNPPLLRTRPVPPIMESSESTLMNKEEVFMDETNKEILRLLRDNGRMPMGCFPFDPACSGRSCWNYLRPGPRNLHSCRGHFRPLYPTASGSPQRAFHS